MKLQLKTRTLSISFAMNGKEQRHVVEILQETITVVKTPVDELDDEFRVH